MSNSYVVKWTINIDADTPVEAAQKALAIQRDPNSIATYFDVSEDQPFGLLYQVELTDGDHNVKLIQSSEANPSNTTLQPEPEQKPASVTRGTAELIMRRARDHHKAELTSQELLDALTLVVEENSLPFIAVDQVLAKRTQPIRKPFQMAVKVELHYDLPRSKFPDWATETSVENMIEEAFADYNRPLTLEAFSKGGVLGIDPAEVSVDTVMAE